MTQRNREMVMPAWAPRGRGRRRYERSRMVYRLMHVEHGQDEGLARCRNISDGGMKIDLFMPVTPGAAIKVAFSGSHVFAGKVIWARDGQCGIAFDDRIDCDAVLRESSAETRMQGFPGLRLHKDVAGTLRFDGLTRAVCIRELSQHGMTLAHDGDVYAGAHLSVTLGADRAREGVVSWSKDNLADIVLLEPFSISELGSLSAFAADPAAA